MESGEGQRSSEEREMEEFFALIRRFHEARSRREREIKKEEEEKEEAIRKRSNQSNYSNKKAKITKKASPEEEEDEERPPSNWAPAFQWEDFNQEKQPAIVSTINIKPGDYGVIINNDNFKKEGENDDLRGLDLNLAL